MAKKKATMTLKDFHGGSIPSDLPLPSAPGVIVRQPDRISFDRPSTWGNPIGRSDHRLRPGSAGAARNVEDRSLFFTNTSNIGRNFDEDERKPLDGGSAPRRIVSDENILALPVGAENNLDYLPVNRTASRPSSTPTSEYSSRGASGLYTGRINEVNNMGVNTHNYSGTSGLGTRPNAWGLRKDSAVKDAVCPTMSTSDAASKMARASALDKVSSGRWHPNQQLMSQVDVEFVSHPEPGKRPEFNGPVMYTKDAFNIEVGNKFQDMSLTTHVGESLTIDGNIHGSLKMFSANVSGRSTASTESDVPHHLVKSHGASTLGNNDTLLPVPSQTAERPKLKLLPRSKPLEKIEPSVEHKKGCNQLSEPAQRKNEGLSPPSTKNGHTGFCVSDQGVERQKWNLQPRHQPLDNVEGANESDRKVVFGSARPRDLRVLKGRDVEDSVTVTHNIDMGQPQNWAKQEFAQSNSSSHQLAATRYVNKEGNVPVDGRAARNSDKRDHRTGVERTDLLHKNWRNENSRNYRRTEERQQQPASQERPPSPESWRKPVEQPVNPDTSGPHYGKVASPLELAQAFSKSKSDMAIPDRLSGHRSFTNRSQVPFSRLTVSSPRPQINGH